MPQMWIDEDRVAAGEKYFLIKISNENTNSSKYVLQNKPPYTNRSFQPKLYGWCGTNNNVATHGEGVWRVLRQAKSGRILIEQVNGEELIEFLEEMGYPEIIWGTE